MELYILSVHAPFNWRNPLSYISAGIRAVTRFKWHHSAFLYINDKGERVILESDIDGVVSVDYKDWAKNKEIAVHLLPANVDKQTVYNRAISRLGNTKYDFRGLLFHHLVNETLGIWIGPKKPGKAYERFTCSEYVAWCTEMTDAYKVTPEQIYNTLPILKITKAAEL